MRRFPEAGQTARQGVSLLFLSFFTSTGPGGGRDLNAAENLVYSLYSGISLVFEFYQKAIDFGVHLGATIVEVVVARVGHLAVHRDLMAQHEFGSLSHDALHRALMLVDLFDQALGQDRIMNRRANADALGHKPDDRHTQDIGAGSLNAVVHQAAHF
jgi:hypothetical protein